MDNTTVINDNLKNFSEIFKTLNLDQKNNEIENTKFVSTEKWLDQLGRRIT